MQDGRAAGVWHMFNDSPVHIALIEYLAKTFHPDLFQDVDPNATLAEINARFSPVTVPGTWWVTNALSPRSGWTEFTVRPGATRCWSACWPSRRWPRCCWIS